MHMSNTTAWHWRSAHRGDWAMQCATGGYAAMRDQPDRRVDHQRVASSLSLKAETEVPARYGGRSFM